MEVHVPPVHFDLKPGEFITVRNCEGKLFTAKRLSPGYVELSDGVTTVKKYWILFQHNMAYGLFTEVKNDTRGKKGPI